jgi:branched-chain amino acid transport system permease protein
MIQIINTFLSSLIPMCVTAIVTMAITLIFRTSFTTNFAQGVISAFGAYVAAWSITKLGLPVLVALPLSMLVSMVIAVLVDVGLFRRGRYVNALSKQIITMGLISIITGLIPVVFGTIDQYMINSLVKGNLVIDVAGNVDISVTYNAIVCVAITAVIIPLIFVLLRYSKWGLSVRATASNEYVAGMMGINTHIVTAVSWGLAGALGALAAYMRASEVKVVTGYFMTEFQVSAFLAGILGGFGTFHGPVICALLIPLAENLVFAAFNILGMSELTGWSKVIVYAISLVIIFIKPQGIFGKKIAKKV